MTHRALHRVLLVDGAVWGGVFLLPRWEWTLQRDQAQTLKNSRARWDGLCRANIVKTWIVLHRCVARNTAHNNAPSRSVPYFFQYSQRWCRVERSGETFSNNTPQPLPDGASGGFGLGDAVYAVTQALGIPHCPPCAARRERLNRLWRMAHAPDPLQSYIISQEKPHEPPPHQPLPH